MVVILKANAETRLSNRKIGRMSKMSAERSIQRMAGLYYALHEHDWAGPRGQA